MKNQKFISAIFALTTVLTIPVAQAEGDAAAGEATYSSMGCMGCHGPAGNSAMPDMFPKLAGLEEDYIIEQLHAFQSGDRASATMQPMVGALNDDDIANLAEYLSDQ